MTSILETYREHVRQMNEEDEQDSINKKLLIEREKLMFTGKQNTYSWERICLNNIGKKEELK